MFSLVNLNVKDNYLLIYFFFFLLLQEISVCPPAIGLQARDTELVPEVSLNEQWVTMSPFPAAGAAAVL